MSPRNRSRSHARWLPGKRRQRLALILVTLSLGLGAPVSVASNQVANDPRLHRYAHWAIPVFLIGSALTFVAGVVLYMLDRPAEGFLPPSPMEGTNRERMLGRVRRQIEDLLWRLPGEPSPIELGQTGRPDLVAAGRPLFVERLERLTQPLSIRRVFGIADEALLILGAPGAGKSQLLAELARDLLKRAERNPTLPIPVIVNLASWATHRHSALAEWLIEELADRYQVPRRLGQSWLNNGQLMPLLDGLDQMPFTHQLACVTAINGFRAEHGFIPLAVCCRQANYEELEKADTQLLLNGAIILQPPTRQQVYDYLEEAGTPLPIVRAALEGDESLWEILQSPLMLSVVARTYQQQPAALLPTTGTLEERRQRLFDAYVDAMLTRQRTQPASTKWKPGDPYQRIQVLCWLNWIAQAMLSHNQSQVRLDRLQPTWLLKRTKQQMVAWAPRVLVCPIVVFLVFWSAEPIGQVAGLLAISALRGNEVRPAEQVEWSWPGTWTFLRTNRLVLLALMGFGISYGMGGVTVASWYSDPGYMQDVSGAHEILFGPYASHQHHRRLILLLLGLLLTLLWWLLMALAILLWRGLSIRLRPTSVSPNEGIRRSAKHALTIGLTAGVAIGLGNSLFSNVNHALISVVVSWLRGWDLPASLSFLLNTRLIEIGSEAPAVITIGLCVGLAVGGYACLQHLILRTLLVQDGCIPWRCVRFLNYAADRVLLRKVGGAYEFIHPWFQERFAAIPAEPAICKITPAITEQGSAPDIDDNSQPIHPM